MESLFRALENAADGAYVIDANQRVVYWNSAAERMLGYAADEVMGRSCYEIIRGRNDSDHVWCQADCVVTAAAQAGEAVDSFNACARTKSGDQRWINVSILSVSSADDNGSQLVVHLFRDATGLKQQEQFAQQVLSAASRFRRNATFATPAVPSNGPSAQLTPRESEVLVLLARGSSTRDIAAALSISASTTRNHVQNIFHKLDVHSRPAAVAYAFEHGLVSDE